jgi:hypothetical protein
MQKAGNIFMDIFSLTSIIFPLIPAAAIFIKKKYHTESLNFLMILCLLNFVKIFLLITLPMSTAAQTIIENIFVPIELIILTQILKSALPGKLNTMANIFLIIFLSVIITVFLLKGITEKMPLTEISQNAIIIFISILSLANLVENNKLYIFNEPLFWIAAGSLFYFSISILMQALTPRYAALSPESVAEKEILLSIGNMAKYFFYTLAVFFYQPPYDKKENFPDY